MEKRHGLLSRSGIGMFGLLETTAVMALIAGLLFLTLGRHNQSIGLRDKDARKEFAKAGINTATYQTTVETVNAKLKNVQAQLADRRDQELGTN